MVTTTDSLGVAHWGLARPSPEKAVFYWFCERSSRQLGETAERIPWQWMDALSPPPGILSRPSMMVKFPSLSPLSPRVIPNFPSVRELSVPSYASGVNPNCLSRLPVLLLSQWNCEMLLLVAQM